MFSKKSIRVLVQNAAGEFKEGVNTFEFKNLPIEAVINRSGSDSMSNIKIYGISKEHVNAITRLPSLGIQQDAQLRVAVYVDDGDGESLLYVGAIRDACPHYTNAPEICIDIHCVAFAFQNLKGYIPPNSFSGKASVPDMYKAVCASFDVPFVDLTIDKEFSEKPPFLDGSIKERLDKLKEAYRNITYTNYNGTIYIYTVGKEKIKRVITPKDYIGYPTFNQYGIGLKLDKVIILRNGEGVEIKDSEIEAVDRLWAIVSVEYNLSTKIGGKWEMNITCYKLEDKNAS